MVGCGESETEISAKLKAAAEAKAATRREATAEVKERAAIVEIANPIIERAIRDSYLVKKPNGELTKSDLEKVTRLSLYNSQLTDVKGLEKLSQLTWLELYSNPDLTLAQIEQLKKALPECLIYSDFE